MDASTESMAQNPSIREVVIDGWVHLSSSGSRVLSPDRPADGPEAGTGGVRGLVLKGVAPPPGVSRFCARGVLRSAELEVEHWSASEVVEAGDLLTREYEALRARVVAHIGSRADDAISEAGLVEFIERLRSDPSVFVLQPVAGARTFAYSVVSSEVQRLAREANDLGCASRVLLTENRWTADDADRADRIIAALPEENIVSIAGGVSAYGDYAMYLTVFDRDEKLERAVATLPEGLLTVETWISEV